MVQLSGERSSAAALDYALAAAHWLDNTVVTRDEGALWPVAEGRVIHAEQGGSADHSLYQGTAGIGIYYLELYQATGESHFRDRARACGVTILRSLEMDAWSSGLYRGLAGAVFFLWEVCRATGEERFYEGARRCVERLLESAAKVGAGVGWREPIPFSESHGQVGTTEILDVSRGSAGVGLGLLYASARGLHPAALDLAVGIGERLIEVASVGPQVDRDGDRRLAWPMMLDQPFAWTAPNFSHGTAGVAYFLACLYEATDETRYLQGALAGAAELLSLTDERGADAELICHHLEGGRELYYVAWCHGPFGTARLYHLLRRLTDEPSWEERLRSLGRGLVGLDVPNRSPGYWNNRGQCCGDAGVGETALMLARRGAGTSDSLDLAWRVADELAEGATVDDDGARWTHAEHRTRPDELATHTGYMQGAAGIGSYFLHLAGSRPADDGLVPDNRVAFPDWPDGF